MNAPVNRAVIQSMTMTISPLATNECLLSAATRSGFVVNTSVHFPSRCRVNRCYIDRSIYFFHLKPFFVTSETVANSVTVQSLDPIRCGLTQESVALGRWLGLCRVIVRDE